jgi:hypothetical protein
MQRCMQWVHQLRLHLQLLQHTASVLLLLVVLVQRVRTIPCRWLLLVLLQERLLQVGQLGPIPKDLSPSPCT